MAKQPYIPFYLGDYLKDTRILPLNIRGGWVDLILYMWDNSIRGELIGTYEDFARLMTCSKEEAILVIQTLNQKKICDHTPLPDGQIKIESRKMKKMEELSKKRKIAGMQGGNPKLLNQTHNLFTEDESKNENKSNRFNPVETPEFEAIKQFFGFNEIAHPHRTREIAQFLTLLNHKKKLIHFKHQFEFYKKYKSESRQTKHSFKKFIEDGWDAENWEHKYNELKTNTQSNGKSARPQTTPINSTNWDESKPRIPI